MTIPVSPAERVEDQIDKTRSASRRKALEAMVDDWGHDSFPASDPPGCLPPSLMSSDPTLHSDDGGRAGSN